MNQSAYEDARQKRVDLIHLLFLISIFIFLYFPVWVSDYIYTDETVQLWLYGKQQGFEMFFQQGRHVTEKLMQWLFGSIHTIREVKYVRAFSFVGWLASIPVWYYILKDILKREALPVIFAFFSTLYLICMPSLSISVVWASCLELFIANTCGVVAGYCMYRAMADDRLKISSGLIWLSIFFGLISLFTYQNGFGCFFIPFIIHALSAKRDRRYLIVSIGGYVFISILYFLLFKWELKAAGIPPSDRTGLHIAPWQKIKFFMTRPMSSAFHFTYLFNERSLAGYIVYALLFGGWAMLYWFRNRDKTATERIISFLILLLFLGLTYLPSLLVKENYASNRTLLALKMGVFILIAENIFYYLKNQRYQQTIIQVLTVLFVMNAWYNTRNLFIKPVQHEYVQLRKYLEEKYNPSIRNIYFIRPEEDFFVKQYEITRSWDEFGVASSFFDWVPEFFTRQIIFEKTHNRELAEKLVIKHWLGEKAFKNAAEPIPANTLVVHAEEIIKE